LTVEEFNYLIEQEAIELDIGNHILKYRLILKELKSDFRYKYTEVTIDKIDHDLETIVIKKEL